MAECHQAVLPVDINIPREGGLLVKEKKIGRVSQRKMMMELYNGDIYDGKEFSRFRRIWMSQGSQTGVWPARLMQSCCRYCPEGVLEYSALVLYG